MAGPARADLPVVWLGVLASSVPHAGMRDPRDPLVCQLKTPEAACTDTTGIKQRRRVCSPAAMLEREPRHEMQ